MDVHKPSNKHMVKWFRAHDMENLADLGVGLLLSIKHQDANKHVDPKLE